MGDLCTHSDLTQAEDGVLVHLAREGGEDAFSCLVQRHMSMVQRQAMRYRGDFLDTDDLAQEGLLGLLAAVKTFEPAKGAPFIAYATICVRNRMISAVRRACAEHPQGREDWSSLEGDAAITSDEGQADPAQLLLAQEESRRLQAWLREALTDLEYRVLRQYVGGHSYEEIARSLHVGSKAVDNALQRARRKLSARLQQGG